MRVEGRVGWGWKEGGVGVEGRVGWGWKGGWGSFECG